MHEQGGNWGPYCRRLECKLFIGSRYKRHNYTWESWHTSIRTRWKKKGGEAYKRGRACGRKIEGKTDKNRYTERNGHAHLREDVWVERLENKRTICMSKLFPHMFR